MSAIDDQVRETVPVPKQPPRLPGPDEWASKRIRHERERLGWSTGELARRATEAAGFRINQSAIWAIESGDPPRKISYGEAVALCEVLDIELDELGAPPEEYARDVVSEAFRKIRDWEAYFNDVVDQLEFIRARAEVDPETYAPVLSDFREAVRRAIQLAEERAAQWRRWLGAKDTSS